MKFYSKGGLIAWRISRSLPVGSIARKRRPDLTTGRVISLIKLPTGMASYNLARSFINRLLTSCETAARNGFSITPFRMGRSSLCSLSSCPCLCGIPIIFQDHLWFVCTRAHSVRCIFLQNFCRPNGEDGHHHWNRSFGSELHPFNA